jgi:alkylated DNA repair protein (DNA oxidative demethylase)
VITAQDTVRRSLDRETQLRLVEQLSEVRSISPFVKLKTPGGGSMSVRVSAAGRLGWTSDEKGYRYVDSDPEGKPWPHIPDEWIEIANSVVAEPQPWDSAIINWYSIGAKLGEHFDESEADCSRPIVVISLGDSASWAVRPDIHSPISRCIISSGDVTVLEGVTRSWAHSIERIIADPLLSVFGATRGRASIRMGVAGPVPS